MRCPNCNCTLPGELCNPIFAPLEKQTPFDIVWFERVRDWRFLWLRHKTIRYSRPASVFETALYKMSPKKDIHGFVYWLEKEITKEDAVKWMEDES